MKKKPRGYWNTKSNVIYEAKKYTSRGEFKKGCDRAWRVATQNGLVKLNVYKTNPKGNLILLGH